MAQGIVKWFNAEKGFGFLRPDNAGADDPDVIVHYTSIEGNGFRTLEENQRVEFDVISGDRGLQARNVRLI
ncbi:cold-shock protein [Corynebacterium sp. 13CS0277]|uniref:cold-shock protein n=1 Tax=Corynebacterium sp. 13CS0277 TaxID=2071994 RepID=UPI000D02A028|nr:cold-shock protein [Corynebacterium sp. 13CS0277]PRQ12173.1 cold-shock protein [Corynebacterium sp. 13CS0277]